jgi:hypothetical protein
MAAPRIDPKQLSPSRLWYWVAGGIAIASVALAAVLFVSILRPLFGDLDEFRAPGSVQVELDKGDTRTIYQRVDTLGDISIGDSNGVSPNDLVCVAGGPDGPVATSRADGFRYTRDNVDYEAKLKFTANASGTYDVACRYGPSRQQPIALAVGPHFGTVGFVTRLVGFFAALFGGPLLGGLLALLVFLLRQRSKKRLQADVRSSWPPPGAAPPPPSDFMDAGR